jgi:competence protein ComGC
MATLFEQLQQRLAQAPAPAPTTPAPNIKEVLAAKTGKAIAPGGIAASNVGAGIATDLSNQALQQQATAGQVQAANLGQQAAGINQASQLAQEKLATQARQFSSQQTAAGTQALNQLAAEGTITDQQRKATEDLKLTNMRNAATMTMQKLASDQDLARNDIFANAKYDTKVLADRSDAAELEQKAFLLALQDKSYMDELKRVGQERRLVSQLDFAAEAQKIALGNQMSQMLQELGFQAGQNLKESEFKEKLARMNANDVIMLGQLASTQANQRAMWEAGGSLIQAGAQGAARYAAKNEEQV